MSKARPPFPPHPHKRKNRQEPILRATTLISTGWRLVSNERDVITFPTRRHLKNASSSRTMGNTSDQIPAEVARELRMLAHDLSNALETIVQATYLISQAAPPENLRRWVELIDQASEEAVKINHKLRQVLRSQS